MNETKKTKAVARRSSKRLNRAAKLEELYSSFGFKSLHENADACQQREFKPLSFLPAVEFTITSMP